MQGPNDVTKRLNLRRIFWSEAAGQFSSFPVRVMIIILALAILACGFGGKGFWSISDRVVILTRLPTFTRTPLAALMADLASDETLPPPPVPTQTENQVPPSSSTLGQPAQQSGATPETINVTAIPTPSVVENGSELVASTETLPTPRPGLTVTAEAVVPTNPQAINIPDSPLLTTAPTPVNIEAAPATNPPIILSPAGWEFTNVQVYPAPDARGLHLYGDVINNTGSPQELDFIAGMVYDAQGQSLAGEDRMVDQWPLDIMPPGAQMPFGLTIDGIQNGANFELNVSAEPIDDFPRQDFEFFNVNSTIKDNKYCVTGSLQNLGNQLEAYLMVVVILYNDQNNVAGFDVSYEFSPQDVLSDQTLDFEVCADPHNQQVAKYDLRAWGS